MKNTLFCFLLLPLWVIAQNPVLTKGVVAFSHTFNPNDNSAQSLNGVYTIARKFPKHVGNDDSIKYQLNLVRERLQNNKYTIPNKKRALVPPLVVSGFMGSTSVGTPNDNNLAVNNDSICISVLNTFIRVYTTNGKFLKNWTLENFINDINQTKPGQGVAPLNRAYDPKVLFDPIANKFILVFLEGDGSADTRIIISFSKTNNPLDGWNVYQITGNPFGGTFWTDYPMIAINNEDLFVTVNLLKDNTDWRDGFTQSVIWQIPTAKGYAADSLPYNLWSNITYNGKAIWNICPVQEAFIPKTKGLYLLSVRPGDMLNDTVFMHHITDNWSSGNAQISYKILKSNAKYGVPPASPQKKAGFRLQTNDARVLGAFYYQDKIQFVQTSRNTINGRSSIYHGRIIGTNQTSPTVRAKIISSDSLDFAYPTIAYAGNQDYGNQSIITFSHNSTTIYPGTSVIYSDNSENYSDLVIAKNGEGYINSFIPDSIERWGDYTSIQRRYNAPFEFWLVGSYGRYFNVVGTWVAKVTMTDPQTNLKEVLLSQPNAYPNPVSSVVCIPFQLTESGNVNIKILNMLGQEVYNSTSDEVIGNKKAFIPVQNLAKGIYYYTITQKEQIIANGSFTKQ